MFGLDVGGTQFTMLRDCPAAKVPQGDPVTLYAGQAGYVMQAFDSHFLVYAEGNLLRVEAAYVDALDRSPPKPPAMPENAGDGEGRIPARHSQRIPEVGAGPSARKTGRDTFTLARDCIAVMVPQGEKVTLKAGQTGYVTQAMGGSFTIFADGNLFRVGGQDADAIGKEVPEPLMLPDDASDDEIETLAWKQLRTCFDPEIPVNVVDLGLVYGLELVHADNGRRNIHVKLTLTAPGCGMGEVLVDDAASKIRLIPTVAEVNIELVFDPPWNYSMMSDEAKLETGMIY